MPCGSVMVTIVLLKLDWMYALPAGTFLRSRRRALAGPRLRSATRGLLRQFAESDVAETLLRSTLSWRSDSDLLLRRCLPAAGHSPAGPLPRAGIGSGALAVHRQAAAMADAAVAADLHQPLDVQVHLAPQVALDRVLTVDDLAQAADLVLGQITHARVRVDVRARRI